MINKCIIPFEFKEKRSGDIASAVADNKLAISLLDWTPKKNLEEIRSGIEISQFQYAPMEIKLISKKRNSFWYNFKLIEGKNREIRNVLGHFGLKVKKLIRISYGEFLLNNQKSGEVLEVPIPQSLLKSAENGSVHVAGRCPVSFMALAKNREYKRCKIACSTPPIY